MPWAQFHHSVRNKIMLWITEPFFPWRVRIYEGSWSKVKTTWTQGLHLWFLLTEARRPTCRHCQAISLKNSACTSVFLVITLPDSVCVNTWLQLGLLWEIPQRMTINISSNSPWGRKVSAWGMLNKSSPRFNYAYLVNFHKTMWRGLG